ncbi:hypothetical protein [Cohnella rhizosphaerae]|uniref:Stage II sporulation protein E N-terminal domain-containing protein n=1 Tax=Cohnella rhizosphaerae TaxID=1457232 RepID=A0A9X4KQH1_9BACL|nr:hypothetical protein [Cohnella rhizosphaerae]MDG0808955.1 hypothetical protein [Cohnella rhizosphaerae]
MAAVDHSGAAKERSIWGTSLERKKGLWLLAAALLGFLLGRASMLEGIAPFAAAYYGVTLYMRREHAWWAAIGLIAGELLGAGPGAGCDRCADRRHLSIVSRLGSV